MTIETFSDRIESRIRAATPPDRQGILREVLDVFRRLGCGVEVPDAQRTDYLNVVPPAGATGGRICSVNCTRSTRVEFQKDSFDLAARSGLGERFDRLAAGNKAALTPETERDLEAVAALATLIIEARRAS